MANEESVDQILKKIMYKAFEESSKAGESNGQNKDQNSLPKKNTKAHIARCTGINETTLGRYLSTEEKDKNSCPSLVEVMEVLRVIDKRGALLEFPKQSKCQAAQFIAEFYPQFLKSNQIVSDSRDWNDAPLASEVLKVINTHHELVDKKLMAQWKGILWLIVFLLSFGQILMVIRIDELAESVDKALTIIKPNKDKQI